jgi:hypothetical protein
MSAITYEFIEMANRASQEIKTLRNQISLLQPRADAYDKISVILSLLPAQSKGYGEDVAWLLDKRITELRAALKTEVDNKKGDQNEQL